MHLRSGSDSSEKPANSKPTGKGKASSALNSDATAKRKAVNALRAKAEDARKAEKARMAEDARKAEEARMAEDALEAGPSSKQLRSGVVYAGFVPKPSRKRKAEDDFEDFDGPPQKLRPDIRRRPSKKSLVIIRSPSSSTAGPLSSRAAVASRAVTPSRAVGPSRTVRPSRVGNPSRTVGPYLLVHSTADVTYELDDPLSPESRRTASILNSFARPSKSRARPSAAFESSSVSAARFSADAARSSADAARHFAEYVRQSSRLVSSYSASYNFDDYHTPSASDLGTPTNVLTFSAESSVSPLAAPANALTFPTESSVASAESSAAESSPATPAASTASAASAASDASDASARRTVRRSLSSDDPLVTTARALAVSARRSLYRSVSSDGHLFPSSAPRSPSGSPPTPGTTTYVLPNSWERSPGGSPTQEEGFPEAPLSPVYPLVEGENLEQDEDQRRVHFNPDVAVVFFSRDERPNRFDGPEHLDELN